MTKYKNKCKQYSLREDLMIGQEASSGNRSLRALARVKEALVAYLLSKVKSGDWHAVQDAASDIREILAKLDILTQRAQQ